MAPESGESRLVLEGVDHSYGDVDVLEDVSLEVPAGVLTAVVGPNGSGKTTLATIAAGLRHPTSGSVELDADAAAERPVAYLPQSPRFRPQLTVEETLTFYADLLRSGTDTRRTDHDHDHPRDADAVDVHSALDEVGLADVADRPTAALSGGMRRLLGLAQSLLGAPSLLVLDEPTSGLDPQTTDRIFRVAAERAADGASVCLTTHDLEYASRADRVVVLDRGRVLVDAPPETVVDRANAASLREAFLSMLGERSGMRAGGTADGSTADDPAAGDSTADGSTADDPVAEDAEPGDTAVENDESDDTAADESIAGGRDSSRSAGDRGA